MCIEIIRGEGDRLERTIFKDDKFCNMFTTYPEVWYKRVLPFRNDSGTNVSQDLEYFAVYHYSAIVRAWGAYRSWIRLNELLESAPTDIGQALLDLHCEYLNFMASARSAIELLAKATAQVGVDHHAGVSDIVKQAEAGRDWFRYTRLMRNDMLHSKTILIQCSDGVFVFDKSIIALDASHAKCWSDSEGDYHNLKDVSGHFWAEFVDGIGHMWKNLSARIDSLDQPERGGSLRRSPGSPGNQPSSYGFERTPGPSAGSSSIDVAESGRASTGLSPEEPGGLD